MTDDRGESGEDLDLDSGCVKRKRIHFVQLASCPGSNQLSSV